MEYAAPLNKLPEVNLMYWHLQIHFGENKIQQINLFKAIISNKSKSFVSFARKMIKFRSVFNTIYWRLNEILKQQKSCFDIVLLECNEKSF